MTILESIRTLLSPGGPMRLVEIYEALPDELQHSIRARIYENLGKHFKRVAPGIYVSVHKGAACVVVAGDVTDEIKKVPSGSIDAIVTDPPYPWLDGHIGHGTTRPRMQWTFDRLEVDVTLGLELLRVLKDGAHAFFFVPAESADTRPHVDRFIRILENCGFKFNKRFIWDKTYGGMGYNGRARYEGILFMSKGAKRQPCNRSVTDLISVRAIHHTNRIHPTEKPVALLERLIEFATRAGEVVLDCFAGSLGTGVAALRTGRNALLIEKSLIEA